MKGRDSGRTTPAVRYVLALAVCIVGSPLPVAATDVGRGAIVLGIAAQQRSYDQLSVGDVRPHTRGEVGGRFEVGILLADKWGLAVSGQLGGHWFDFNGPGVSGRTEDLTWRAGASLDRLIAMPGKQLAFVGLGFEYGEARSWVDNLIMSDEGPHNYLVGASLRMGIATRLGSRFYPYLQIDQSVYRGHAKDWPLGSEYNWLGRSLSGSIGLKYALLRGRQDQS